MKRKLGFWIMRRCGVNELVVNVHISNEFFVGTDREVLLEHIPEAAAGAARRAIQEAL